MNTQKILVIYENKWSEKISQDAENQEGIIWNALWEASAGRSGELACKIEYLDDLKKEYGDKFDYVIKNGIVDEKSATIEYID